MALHSLYDVAKHVLVAGNDLWIPYEDAEERLFNALPVPPRKPLPEGATRHAALPAQCLAWPGAMCALRGR